MSWGDGTIIKKPGGKWEVQVSTGWDAAKGRYGRATATVYGTKADAKKKLRELRELAGAGVDLQGRETLFCDFVQTWIERRRTGGELAEKSIKDGETIGRALVEQFGKLRICDINAQVVEDGFCQLKARRKIGNTTLKKYHVFMKQIMQKAVDYDYILRNPCDRVKPPRADAVERKALTEFEAARLRVCIRDEYAAALAEFKEKERRQAARGNCEGRESLYGLGNLARLLAVRVALSTGARLGEILALTWGDLGERTGRVSVSKSLTDGGAVKAPKTSAGRRVIPLDRDTLQTLADWREIQKAGLDTLGASQTKDTPILCSDTGGHIPKAGFERFWRAFRARHGFNGLKFHELRHTYATLLIARGVDIKTVQYLLGHTTARLTLDFYAHAMPDNIDETAAVMGAILTAGGGETGARIGEGANNARRAAGA